MTKICTAILIASTGPCSDFVKNLFRTWRDVDPTVQALTWDAKGKRFAPLLATEYLDRLGIAPSERASDEYHPSVVDFARRGSLGWIVVPELFMTSMHVEQLVEVDIILEARRIAARSCFIFHGAAPLRSDLAVVRATCERYMQGLLLADLVLPISRLALDQIIEFFIRDQRADYLPSVIKLTLPVEIIGSDLNWSDYVRKVRGILADRADHSRRLTSLYLLGSYGDEPSPTLLARDLSNALEQRGTRTHFATWNAVDGHLKIGQHRAPATERPASSDGVPAGSASGAWLILTHLKDHPLDRIVVQAHAIGLRVAAIVDEEDALDPAALARLDKILAASEESRRLIDRAMLGWRGKFTNAEHRVATIAKPTEVLGERRRTAPHPSDQNSLRVAIWGAGAVFPALVEGVTDAMQKSDVPLSVTLFTAEQTLHVPIGDAGNAAGRFQVRQESESLVSTLASTDVVIHSEGGKRDVVVAHALWRAIPCLLHASDIPTPTKHQPGVMYVDMSKPADVTKALLKLCRPDVRLALASEAIARPVGTWDDYAAKIARELVEERREHLLPAERTYRKRLGPPSGGIERPKLSICISTYKRAGWLAVNLRNLFEQLPDDGRIEILVVDNASPDMTPEVVRPYLTRRNFRYRRNFDNVGMLGNLTVSSQLARGEYIWILGDDDLTRPGAIQKVLEIIDDHPSLGLIYMNYGYSFEHDPSKVVDLHKFLTLYNVLQPEEPDRLATVSEIAARSENFYTAIYCIIFKRDHAMRAYGQDTSGRIFSTMESCIPTAAYILNYMPNMPAYWIGWHALIMNSNVSWGEYAPLFELEQFPRAWDLAEIFGTPSAEVDQRREDRLPHTLNAWSNVFDDDRAGNGAFLAADRVLMRLKHLKSLDGHIPRMYAAYEKAHVAGLAHAKTPPATLFAAFPNAIKR